MRIKYPLLVLFIALFLTVFSSANILYADILFFNRQIYLSNEANRSFSVGITGTTAGHNYLPLIENAKQEALPLGNLGYWELVPDPPSSLRNYDLQLIIENNSKGRFQIEFEYDSSIKNIVYRIKDGDVTLKLDLKDYYPKLIVEDVAADISQNVAGLKDLTSKRYIFFDFNSFDVELRKYYGDVKKISRKSGYTHYFYYYEAGNYNSYYFKVYNDITSLDTDKMGLSQEDGSIVYYQRVLDNLKARFGNDFAQEVIIVSRFGDAFSDVLKNYSREIGIRLEKGISFLSYENIFANLDNDQ